MSITIAWRVSLSATSLHAAEAVVHSSLPVETKLRTSIAEPNRQLQSEILAAGLDEKKFWEHLVPLSGAVENNRHLIEAALRKAAGEGCCSPMSIHRLAGCVADLEAAVRRAQPDLLDTVAAGADQLRQQWQAHGDGLLCQIGRLTE